MTAPLPIPKERLAEIHKLAAKSDKYIYHLRADEVEAMTRALLAAYEQEPVAWQWQNHGQWHVTNDEERARDLAWDGVDVLPLYTHPEPSIPAVSDYFAGLVAAARVRADKAMRKFPQPNYVLNKVAEESGEVIKAVIHYTEGREEWAKVESEIIDNLAMLLRLVIEGDQVIGFTPPDSCLVSASKGV